MSLPPQDVLDGIDELIAEITGLQVIRPYI